MIECDKDGCSREAAYSPIITVAWPDGVRVPPLRFFIASNFCEECHLDVRPDDLYGDDFWRALVARSKARGGVPPDRSKTSIEWRRIGRDLSIIPGLNRKRRRA